MLLGRWLGRRALAIGITSALAVGSYLLNAFAPAVEGFAWAARLSPFFYTGSPPLRNGLHVGHAGVLAAVADRPGRSVLEFDRRDLRT